jgi:hypothetical protein
MKRTSCFVILSILILTGCRMIKHATTAELSVEKNLNATADENSVDFSKQETWLLGYFDRSRLRNEPYSTWFFKGYDGYAPGSGAMEYLKTLDIQEISIKVVMGTWCPDSRREVPRFEKILDSWQFPAGKLTYIGVDNAKLSPIGEYDGLDIHRVPTFIIYRNNVEAGRIIENPVTSLEQDIVNILRGMNNNK